MFLNATIKDVVLSKRFSLKSNLNDLSVLSLSTESYTKISHSKTVKVKDIKQNYSF